MTIVASLSFTPAKTGLCIGYASFGMSVTGGGSLRLRLLLVNGSIGATAGGWAGVPERGLQSSTQTGLDCSGNAGSALFSVIGGVTYTLQLECYGFNGVVTGSSVNDIYLRARAYKI